MREFFDCVVDWWEDHSLLVKLPLAVIVFGVGVYLMFHDVM